MITNLPGLAKQHQAQDKPPVYHQESFSSLDLPGGFVGEPHSRKSTPNNGSWMQQVDLARLFGGTFCAKSPGYATSHSHTPSNLSMDSDDEEEEHRKNSLRETVQGISWLGLAKGRKDTYKVSESRGFKERVKSWWGGITRRHPEPDSGSSERYYDRNYESDYLVRA